MEIFLSILKVIAVMVIAFIVGRLVAKIKLPAILGWLIVGMAFGPFGFKFISAELLGNIFYNGISNLAQCFVGVMIGSELIWKKLKSSGKQIVFTTLWQSLGTFAVVTLVFGIIFYFMHIPVYVAFIFGGISLATAPAPALSIVKEFKTRGPVTDTLIPMAALDDVVGVIVFFTVISIVSAMVSTGGVSPLLIVAIIFIPLVIGAVVGISYGFISRKISKSWVKLLGFIVAMLIGFGAAFAIDNFALPSPSLNYMLLGMMLSALFANFADSETAEKVFKDFSPVLMVSLVFAILNLGAPLDFRLIAGAGIFTLVYILARAAGKIGGCMLGAKLNKCDKNVVKYLGLTLLPHSGVSLVFTGIAVGILAIPAPEEAKIIQGTIAAAAIINEVIAVIISRFAFKWAGEINQNVGNTKAAENILENPIECLSEITDDNTYENSTRENELLSAQNGGDDENKNSENRNRSNEVENIDNFNGETVETTESEDISRQKDEK